MELQQIQFFLFLLSTWLLPYVIMKWYHAVREDLGKNRIYGLW